MAPSVSRGGLPPGTGLLKVGPSKIQGGFITHAMSANPQPHPRTRGRKFGAAGAVILGLLLAVGLLLRIWPSTPEGVEPVIKVRGLDLIQASSLARSAASTLAAGQLTESMQAWRLAIEKNPGDPKLHRGILGAMLSERAPRRAWMDEGALYSGWLLRLSHTNRSDVGLVAKVASRQHNEDAVLDLLTPLQGSLDAAESAVFAKALFHTGRMEAFESRRAGLRGNPDPEVALYEAAWRSGWGPQDGRTEGRRSLEAATRSPGIRVTAHRLLLATAWRTGDPAIYERSLKELAEWGEDDLSAHLVFWRLLSNSGNRPRAIELATSRVVTPATAAELLQLTDTLRGLGLEERAIDAWKRSAGAFSNVPEVWIGYSGMLIELGRWEDLQALAIQMRNTPPVAAALEGYSHFLEGRAALGLTRTNAALDGFRKASESKFPIAPLILKTARNLLRLDQADLARSLLLTNQANPGLDASALAQTLFDVAYTLKDEALLIDSARRAQKALPDEAPILNNLASALLLTRQNPSEALRHTLSLHSKQPQVAAFRINHAIALIQNHRHSDGLALLADIPFDKFTLRQQAGLHLARLEAHIGLAHWPEAQTQLEAIRPQLLMPSQVAWLEQARRELNARNGHPASNPH